jgi:hypothetical protein
LVSRDLAALKAAIKIIQRMVGARAEFWTAQRFNDPALLDRSAIPSPQPVIEDT